MNRRNLQRGKLVIWKYDRGCTPCFGVVIDISLDRLACTVLTNHGTILFGISQIIEVL